MLDALAEAFEPAFADAEELAAALACTVTEGLAVVMVPGVTVAAAVVVLTVPGVGVLSLTVAVRVGLEVAFALVALGLGTTVAFGEAAVVAPPEHADRASRSVAPSATGL